MKAAVFATRRYEREAKRLLTDVEIETMEASIAADPEAHPVVRALAVYAKRVGVARDGENAAESA